MNPRSTTKTEEEGITILKIEADEGDFAVHFERVDGGARDWSTLTDSFADALRALRRFGHANGVKWYRPQSYLGRGAAVRLPWKSLVLAVGLWLEQACVYLAIKRGAVRVTTRRGVPRGILQLGPRYLAALREKNEREDAEHIEELE
jgi:hypothetical protein